MAGAQRPFTFPFALDDIGMQHEVTESSEHGEHIVSKPVAVVCHISSAYMYKIHECRELCTAFVLALVRAHRNFPLHIMGFATSSPNIDSNCVLEKPECAAKVT